MCKLLRELGWLKRAHLCENGEAGKSLEPSPDFQFRQQRKQPSWGTWEGQVWGMSAVKWDIQKKGARR